MMLLLLLKMRSRRRPFSFASPPESTRSRPANQSYSASSARISSTRHLTRLDTENASQRQSLSRPSESADEVDLCVTRWPRRTASPVASVSPSWNRTPSYRQVFRVQPSISYRFCHHPLCLSPIAPFFGFPMAATYQINTIDVSMK